MKDDLILKLGRKTASVTLTLIVDEDINMKLNKASQLLNMSKSAIVRAILAPVLEKNYGDSAPIPAKKPETKKVEKKKAVSGTKQ